MASPTAASSFSIRTRSPWRARYCLPPVRKTAYTSTTPKRWIRRDPLPAQGRQGRTCGKARNFSDLTAVGQRAQRATPGPKRRATGHALPRLRGRHRALWVAMDLAETRPAVPSLDALRAAVGDDWGGVNRVIVRRL